MKQNDDGFGIAPAGRRGAGASRDVISLIQQVVRRSDHRVNRFDDRACGRSASISSYLMSPSSVRR